MRLWAVERSSKTIRLHLVDHAPMLPELPGIAAELPCVERTIRRWAQGQRLSFTRLSAHLRSRQENATRSPWPQVSQSTLHVSQGASLRKHFGNV